MMYKIEFSKDATKTAAKYKKSNPVLYKKLVNLLDEIMEHPRTGTGHPEPLKAGNSISYSRRITAHDRCFLCFFWVYMGRFALHSDRTTIGKTRMLFLFCEKR